MGSCLGKQLLAGKQLLTAERKNDSVDVVIDGIFVALTVPALNRHLVGLTGD